MSDENAAQDHVVQTELLPVSTLEIGKIHQGDCLELMQRIDTGTIDLVFADPPFNIGYEYDQYHDRQEDEEYIAWSWKLPRPGDVLFVFLVVVLVILVANVERRIGEHQVDRARVNPLH